MKRSEELKIQKGKKVERMQALLNLQKGENKRALTEAENTEFNNLKTEVETLNTEIENAEFVERNAPAPAPAPIPAPQIKRNAPKVYSTSKAIREFINGGAAGLTGFEKDEQERMAGFGLSSNGILVPANYRAITASTTTTNAGAIDAQVDPNLSVLGKDPLWSKMGLTVMPNLQGTFKLNKKAAAVAENPSETAAIATGGGSPTAVTMAPERYGISDLFSKELLASENPALHAALIEDLLVGVDRKISADVYTTALAAATETTGGALTVAGFDILMAAVDADGAFAMDRGSFFSAKGVKVDTGSGKFLAEKSAINGVGASHDGTPIYYSQLFADGTDQQYVLYGAWREMYLGLWGAVEVLINPYSKQKEGQVEVTVNRLADVICRNSAAFVKSPDLDAA